MSTPSPPGDASPGTTVVLGWDGLDADLLSEFDLEPAFGAHVAEIGTIRNDAIGEPHTREIWPSIITGLFPDSHGIRVDGGDDGDSVEWSNPLLDVASSAAEHVLPEDVRAAVGRRLLSRGATPDVELKTPLYYASEGLSTMFDRRRSYTVALPNYWTVRDEAHGFVKQRFGELSGLLERTEAGWAPADADAQAAAEEEMWMEAGRKLAVVEHSLQREYDIVFVWLGFLDTVGHIEPTVQEPLQRRAYNQAAAWTRHVREQLRPEDRLVCVSDHGLQDGEHTMAATFAADDHDLVDGVDSVLDVRPALGPVTPTRATADDSVRPPFRGGVATGRSGAAAPASAVRDHLEELGYV